MKKIIMIWMLGFTITGGAKAGEVNSGVTGTRPALVFTNKTLKDRSTGMTAATISLPQDWISGGSASAEEGKMECYGGDSTEMIFYMTNTRNTDSSVSYDGEETNPPVPTESVSKGVQYYGPPPEPLPAMRPEYAIPQCLAEKIREIKDYEVIGAPDLREIRSELDKALPEIKEKTFAVFKEKRDGFVRSMPIRPEPGDGEEDVRYYLDGAYCRFTVRGTPIEGVWMEFHIYYEFSCSLFGARMETRSFRVQERTASFVITKGGELAKNEELLATLLDNVKVNPAWRKAANRKQNISWGDDGDPNEDILTKLLLGKVHVLSGTKAPRETFFKDSTIKN
jgi:hypothetical protein